MGWLKITHVTSSPEYPQSNGQAEVMVKSAKKLLARCKAEGKHYLPGLIELRNTPISADIPSPAALLQGRLLPSHLPTPDSMLFPQGYDPAVVRKLFEERQSMMKYYYDRKAGGELSVLGPGQSVQVKIAGSWISGRVKSHSEHPRSYWVTCRGGAVLRRNRKDIRPTGEVLKPSQIVATRPICPPPSTAQAPATPVTPNNTSDDGLQRSSFGRVIRCPDRLTYP
jgi:hypothetical protein